MNIKKKCFLLLALLWPVALLSCQHYTGAPFAGKSLRGIAGSDPEKNENTATPGLFVVDPPTYNNLGFRWYLAGDTNRNASVDVRYRRAGDVKWNPAIPLLRVLNEIVDQDYNAYRTGNLFAGSILDLAPDTKYTVEMTLRDPDNGQDFRKIATVRTKKELAAPEDLKTANVVEVFPPDSASVHADGVPTTIQAALDNANPGDIIKLYPGIYPETIVFNRSGTREKPIVLMGSSSKPSVIRGPDHQTDLLNVQNADHIVLHGLVLERAKAAVRGGGKALKRGDPALPAASHVTITNCVIHDVETGIITYSEKSIGWTISDNVIVGNNPAWFPRERSESLSHTGVNIYGRGHVVRYNFISDFWDNLAIANFGMPVDDIQLKPVAIDFHNNELTRSMDDGIEADFGAHNVRVYQNQIFNSHTALSVQPFYGGPLYLIRNISYGIYNFAYKLHNFPAGLIIINNTSYSCGSGFKSPAVWQNANVKNNLFMGASKFAIDTGTITDYSTMDYNAYSINSDRSLIRWKYGHSYQAYYDDLASFFQDTGNEAHGFIVSHDIFRNAPIPECGQTYNTQTIDLRLKANATPIDSGIAIAQVSANASGGGPDIGAYEAGTPMPTYGPRHATGYFKKALQNARQGIRAPLALF